MYGYVNVDIRGENMSLLKFTSDRTLLRNKGKEKRNTRVEGNDNELEKKYDGENENSTTRKEIEFLKKIFFNDRVGGVESFVPIFTIGVRREYVSSELGNIKQNIESG